MSGIRNPNDPRLTYVSTATKAIEEHQDKVKELGDKRRKALHALQEDEWTITEIAERTGINRQTLYRASKDTRATSS